MPCCLGHFWIQQGTLFTLVELPAFVNPIDLYSLTLCFSNPGVFVSLGCYNKIPWTGWLINNTHLFLQGRGRTLEIGGQAGQVRALCQVADVSACAHMVEG